MCKSRDPKMWLLYLWKTDGQTEEHANLDTLKNSSWKFEVIVMFSYDIMIIWYV